VTTVAIARPGAAVISLGVHYTYDIFDRRIAKTVGATTTQYSYDGDAVDLVFSGATSTAALVHRYLQGPLVDQLFTDETLSGPGPGTNYWPLTDNLGTIRDEVDNSGNLVTHFQYTVFGGFANGTAPTTDVYGYTGREYDKETGLYFDRARYYDMVTGNFISQDPIGFTADVNPYRYGKNNPTGVTDPSGLEDAPIYRNYFRDPLTGRLIPARNLGGPIRHISDNPLMRLDQFLGSVFMDTGERAARFFLSHEFQEGLRLIGGLLEAASGVFLLAAPEPTGASKAFGLILIGHGFDTVNAAGNSLETGKHIPTFTQKGASRVVRGLGADPETAEVVAAFFDAGVPIVVNLGAAGLSFMRELSSARTAINPLIEIERNADLAVDLTRQAAARGQILKPQKFGVYAHQRFAELNETLGTRLLEEGSPFTISVEEFRDALGRPVLPRTSGSIGEDVVLRKLNGCEGVFR
jgi:RHS repeat-associated protein